MFAQWVIHTVTVASALSALPGQYHADRTRERDKTIAVFAGSESRANFRYTILGWEIPHQAAWLWKAAKPELDSVTLRPNGEKPLPEAFCYVAKRSPRIEYEGITGGDDAYLRRCVSEKTTEIRLFRNGVSGECLAFVGECPNLRRIDASHLTLTSKSLTALLNHPRIEELVIHAEADDLSLVGKLARPNALTRLEIDIDFDWSRPLPEEEEPLPRPRAPGAGPRAFLDRRPAGDFVWLKQCEQLREITMSMPSDSSFLAAVGHQLRGVQRLNLSSCDKKHLESLGSWERLRWLTLEGMVVSDKTLARLVELCDGVTTLEIDEYPESKVSLSPDGIRSLRKLKGLTRLRLGMCNLTRAHFEAIAELRGVEELSIEDKGVNDRVIEPLAKLPKLRRISLERTKASDKVFANIRGDWDANRPIRFLGSFEAVPEREPSDPK